MTDTAVGIELGMVAQTRKGVDSEGNGGTAGNAVESVEATSQQEIDRLELEKQKKRQQPESIEAEKSKDKGEMSEISRRLWYGIFLTCGLLMLPNFPGTAFLILPMQVAGFAMIPLNKREVKSIAGNRCPRDFLLTPEGDKSDDAAFHSGKGTGTSQAGNRDADIDLDVGAATLPEIPIDFGVGGAASSPGSQVKKVSADELKAFLKEKGGELGADVERFIDENERGANKGVSAEQIRQFCKEYSEALDPKTKTALEGMAKNLEGPERPVHATKIRSKGGASRTH